MRSVPSDPKTRLLSEEVTKHNCKQKGSIVSMNLPAVSGKLHPVVFP